ncbi:MAG: hypothetical protein ACD_3C00013G0004 [uncultured bacterium (gcode 4)]|uniref:Uncharacterized protein n=1 Tax=uncultured bacterium (gcode 4) TaxID=1234023 RepID=K2FCJ5_9BACT|nr:MAG: hypothetical protein ACD_3C00013G0004 [uncultured bacterium (gcode 4)]
MNTEDTQNKSKEHWFIIWDKKFTVWEENELWLIFEMLNWDSEVSSILHWNIIMELDEELMNIIKTYKGLINCLKSLNEKNSFLLLFKISDTLSDIVQDSRELWEILAKISEEWNKLRLIKQMRNRWLTRLITSSQDLLHIIEWVYDAAEKQTLDILWSETIRWLFTSPQDVYDVLHYLNDENKDYLMDIIWLYEISKKIRSWEDFLLMLKWISCNKVNEFLSLYSKRMIKEYFKTDREFTIFLMKLSDRKEKIFLNYMWINIK